MWTGSRRTSKRPSFALELQKTEMADLNLFLVRKTTTVLITGFVDVDYYHDSSREELVSVRTG